MRKIGFEELEPRRLMAAAPPSIDVIPPAPIARPEPGTSVDAIFTVKLSQATTSDVSVHYATTDGFAKAYSDYIPAYGVVTIPAGQTSATVTVRIIGSATFVAPESFSLVLTDSSNANLPTPAATPATILSQSALRLPGTFDLTATTTQTKFQGGVLLPDSPVSGKVVITNTGDAFLVNSTFNTEFYLSTDSTYSPDDVLVATVTHQVKLFAAHKTMTLATSFRVPKTLPPGSYHLVSVIDPGNTLRESDDTDNIGASSNAMPVVYQFGNVPGRGGNTRLTMDSPNGDGGTPITFALSGKGIGTVSVQPNGALSVTFDKTGNGSVASFKTPRGSTGSVLDITVNGSLQSIVAPTVDLLGHCTTTGTIKKTVFHKA